jgi:hypothetical protein
VTTKYKWCRGKSLRTQLYGSIGETLPYIEYFGYLLIVEEVDMKQGKGWRHDSLRCNLHWNWMDAVQFKQYTT